MLALHVIGSGSKGNCAIVQDCESGHGVMVDCGICRRDTFARAAEAGFDMSLLDAILVTHDHSDHTSKLGVIARGLKRESLPLYVLPEVEAASDHVKEAAKLLEARNMQHGEAFYAGEIAVLPFRTSHDAAASCGFRFESQDGDAVGFMTDTGYVTEEAADALAGVRILAIESNHDAKMLAEGPYPYYLKMRVASDAGHLSNDQAKEALASLGTASLEHVVAMHLSENNNLPSLAREALEQAVSEAALGAKVTVASQRMLVSAK